MKKLLPCLIIVAVTVSFLNAHTKREGTGNYKSLSPQTVISNSACSYTLQLNSIFSVAPAFTETFLLTLNM